MAKEVRNALRRLVDAWNPRTMLVPGNVSTSIKYNIRSHSIHLEARTRARLPRQSHIGESTIVVHSLTHRDISIALGDGTIMGRRVHTTITKSKISSPLSLGKNFARCIYPSLVIGSLQEVLGLGPLCIIITLRRGWGDISWRLVRMMSRREGLVLVGLDGGGAFT